MNMGITTKFKQFKKSILSFILTNRLFISFLLLTAIETSLLIVFTMGLNAWGWKPLLFDLAIIIIIGALAYLFKPDKQYKYFQTIMIIITIVCVINGIYYSFYNSFVTIGLLESLGQVNTVTDAVFEKLTPLHAIYILFPLIFMLINKKLKYHNYFNYIKKIENGKKNLITASLVGIIFLFINLVCLTPTDVSRLVKQWNREYIVERYGIILYQLNDLVQSAQTQLSSYFGYDKAAQKFNDFYANREIVKSNNRYTNIYKGKNVVFIHMESMMNMFVNLKINGVEVTPNLNKLTEEGIYFSNFYPQISTGTSSDTEFTLNTSLMPALSGTVFVSYYDRNYNTIEKILNKQGYYTFSMHANNASMWNRGKMHESMGYQKFYSYDSFEVNKENSIGLGLSDHDFFKQIIPYLKDIELNNTNYMGTLITLTNHTPWDGGDKYGEFELTKTYEKIDENGKKESVTSSYLKDTKIGDYIRSVHYADKALGEFINSIYENDIFNNTVLVFYGDHDSKLSSREYNYLYNYSPEDERLLTSEDEGYTQWGYYENELNRKTPLIIWTKDKKIKKKVDYYMGMIDVMPTIGNMLGFENPYALGHDIFEIKNDNIIVFPNGNFLTSSIYYNNTKSEYRVLKESSVIDESYIQNCKEYTENVLEISNDIIVYNLIETEGEKIANEKE